MIVEGIGIAILFFIAGYLTDKIDFIMDELKKNPNISLQLFFLLLIGLTAIVGYYYFPSPYIGAVLGLMLSGKVDKLIFVLAAVFFIPYVFLNIDYKVAAIFALSTFLDEKPAFSKSRPLLKILSIGYGLFYNPFIIAAFGSFDLGYEYNDIELNKGKKKKL